MDKVIRQFLVKVQNSFVNYLVVFGNSSKKSNINLMRLGTSYGGWWVPKHIIEDKHISRVSFSIGIGHDVSFDKEVLKSGFQVIALDPLEECVNFAKENLAGYSGVYLENLGLATYTGRERFFAPKSKAHDSWSSTNSQLTEFEESIVLDVICLTDLLAKYESNFRGAWTLLKMDIEGAERRIIPSLCDLGYSFDYVAIEMDFLSLIPFLKLRTRLNRIKEARELLRKMNSRGYRLIKNENFNYFWSFEQKIHTRFE
jgi:FkbM family methyltransferase